MPYACIFVPDFPVEAVLRAEPELRSQAVAVLEGRPPQQKVFGVNSKARSAGIEIGMTRLQAEACPELVLRCRSFAQETAAHAALLECAKSFSPRVEDSLCDTVVLDISGTERLLGPTTKVAHDIAREAFNRGLETNVGVASKADAATLAARGYAGVTVIAPGKEEDQLNDLPLQVLLASVPGFETERASELLETFERWGIRTLRALNDLPPLALSERMGQQGLRLQELARGAVSRTIVPADPPLVFEETVELEYPLVLLEPLAFLLGRMLDQVCARLSDRAFATQELHLKLELETGIHLDEEQDSAGEEQGFMTATSADAKEPGHQPWEYSENDVARAVLAVPQHSFPSVQQQLPLDRSEEVVATNEQSSLSESRRGGRFLQAAQSTFTRTLRLPVPMLDPKIFLKLFQLDLKAHPPGAPIQKITLTAEPARSRPGQAGLFLPPTPEPEKLELTLARISGIVGEQNVGSLELLDTHNPSGFRLQHFNPFVFERKNSSANGNSKSGKKETKDDTGETPAVTALRIFRPHLQATVTLRDGRPAHIACLKNKDVNGDVIWDAGPWRSSGDWWEKEAWARDEWDIALQTSSAVLLYRLVRDLLAGKWYLEGSYD